MPAEPVYAEIFGNLLAYLQGLYHTYQFLHWQSSGSSYYGDHLLFQRLYGDIEKEIDPLAEKAIGVSNDPRIISPIQHSNLVSKYLVKFADGAEDGIHAGLRAERWLLKLISQARLTLKQQGKLTDGVDNMLQGFADAHEGHVYLLQQRLSNPQGVQAMLEKNATANVALALKDPHDPKAMAKELTKGLKQSKLKVKLVETRGGKIGPDAGRFPGSKWASPPPGWNGIAVMIFELDDGTGPYRLFCHVNWAEDEYSGAATADAPRGTIPLHRAPNLNQFLRNASGDLQSWLGRVQTATAARGKKIKGPRKDPDIAKLSPGSAPSTITSYFGKPHKVDKKVWAWHVKEAKKNKEWAEKHKFRDNPDDWPASMVSIDMLKERLAASVEELALKSYKYHQMRAFQNAKTWGSQQPLDPEARKKWESVSGKPIPEEEIVQGSTTAAKNTGDPPKIAKIRRIVDQKQYAKVDGVMVDLFTASVIVKVYDALNDVNKMKFAGMPVAQMANVAYKLVKSSVATKGDVMFNAKAKRETIATLLRAGRPDLVKEVMALKPTNIPGPVADALNALQKAKQLRYPGSTIQNLFREFQNVCKQYHVDPQRLLSMASVKVNSAAPKFATKSFGNERISFYWSPEKGRMSVQSGGGAFAIPTEEAKKLAKWIQTQ